MPPCQSQEIVPGPGKCGDDLTWALDMETGELTISGTGDMWDWGSGSDYSPWYPLAESIKKVTIQDAVTGIGNNAFYQCAMTKESIPKSVTALVNEAFQGCESLERVTLQEGLKTIGTWTFSYCTKLAEVTVPASVEMIETYAFDAATT